MTAEKVNRNLRVWAAMKANKGPCAVSKEFGISRARISQIMSQLERKAKRYRQRREDRTS